MKLHKTVWIGGQVDRNGGTRIDSVLSVTRHFDLIEILGEEAKKNQFPKELFHKIRIE